MDSPQNLSKSDRRWFDLIQQWRASGKSDHQWLIENNISPSTFYYHVNKLRKKACEIPANAFSGVSETQEVVLLVINEDVPQQKNNADIPETVSSSNETVLRLTFQDVTMAPKCQWSSTFNQAGIPLADGRSVYWSTKSNSSCFEKKQSILICAKCRKKFI